MRTSGAVFLVLGFLASFATSSPLNTPGKSLADPQNTSLKADGWNLNEHNLEARRIPTGKGSRVRGGGGRKGKGLAKRWDETSGNEHAEWEEKEAETNESNLNKHPLETKHTPTVSGPRAYGPKSKKVGGKSNDTSPRRKPNKSE